MSLIQCLYPRYVYNKYLSEYVSVPCGKCSVCRSLRAVTWANRLELECASHKYCLFGTLTYTDDHLPRYDVSELPYSDTLASAISDSYDFIVYNDGFIPYCNVKDFQDFIKRVRTYILRDYGIKSTLRYFCAFEYGPSSFRPHMHYLLWFDDDVLRSVIKECIYKSWKFKNSCASRSIWFRRNQQRFVVGYSVAGYLASYLNCSSNLPPLLYEPALRAKHVQSINPPIGCGKFTFGTLQKLSCGVSTQISFRRPSTGRNVVLPLWKSFENRWFPRCQRYSSLSYHDRLTLYTLADFYLFGSSASRFFQSSTMFATWVLSKWSTSLPLIRLLRSICPSSYLFRGQLFEREWPKRLFDFSERFIQRSKELGLSPSYYVLLIGQYYSRKEYFKLVSYFEEQVSYSQSTPRENYPLNYLPFILDPQFYDNRRSLPSSTYEEYLRQFGVTGDLIYSLPFNSRLWKDKRVLFDKIVSDNTKTRVKKEWVSMHPEFTKFYTNLISYK